MHGYIKDATVAKKRDRPWHVPTLKQLAELESESDED